MDNLYNFPTGGITYKTINGKKYAYYQWRENGKQKSRRVHDDELEQLTYQIEQRKKYQKQIKEGSIPYGYQYSCLVQIGTSLDAFVEAVKSLEKRECYQALHDYIYGPIQDRVFILFGLRRTGKTTLIRQAILEMSPLMKSQTAFLQVQQATTLASLHKDLRYLESLGMKYIFIDEVTLLEDFIEGAAMFSDIFASSGMKIILSGTDSLGFMFSQDEELFDRCQLIHTTFIPYREFNLLLKQNSLDDYLRYGGTLSLSGNNYNHFSSSKKVNEYIDSAIAHNIQHSLKNYQYGNHFRGLKDLYENNELTNIIQRVVKDMNHRFTLDILNQQFKSQPEDIQQVTQVVKDLLEIPDLQERQIEVNETHVHEIQEYLELLDLIDYVDLRWMSPVNKKESRTIITQPGLRFCQAEVLIKALMQDPKFANLSLKERKRVTERILSEIKGRMLEDLILLETKYAYSNLEVFKLQFAIGEFDMVIFNEELECCEIYEIKHSFQALFQQCHHLLDSNKCEATAFRYGDIISKNVLYQGETTDLIFENELIHFINIEEYLLNLKRRD